MLGWTSSLILRFGKKCKYTWTGYRMTNDLCPTCGQLRALCFCALTGTVTEPAPSDQVSKSEPALELAEPSDVYKGGDANIKAWWMKHQVPMDAKPELCRGCGHTYIAPCHGEPACANYQRAQQKRDGDTP